MVRSLSAATQAASAQAGAAVVGVRRYERSRYGNGNYLSQRGSGVIVREDGIVVTNRHVIRDAAEVRVLLQDGRELEAEVVGADADTDLAVLRIDGDGYPAAEFIDDREPAVGEWVLAMGNPFGLDLTVTMGIVSGTRRSDLDIARYEDFIQTDAAINPGNSGGALVDLEGRVVGINTAMGTPEEGSNGIGYATPAWFVKPVVEGILTEGKVVRGFLGVRISRLNDRWASLAYDGTSRAVVSYAIDGSPAEQAGLERGDVIETVDGKPITADQQVHNAIGFRRPGDSIRLGVWRDGARLEIDATLANRDG
ncbi:MAG: trypsin-like peptidase domain-containing protein [Planctomycetota bacterium]